MRERNNFVTYTPNYKKGKVRHFHIKHRHKNSLLHSNLLHTNGVTRIIDKVNRTYWYLLNMCNKLELVE